MTTVKPADKLEGPRTRGEVQSHHVSPVRAFVSASLARGQVEILQFFRSKDAVVFTLALPGVLLALLASIFSGFVHGTDVRYSQVYTTGLLAGGLASTSFLNLAVAIAGERENGALKRLAGTPMPRTSYFAGKAIVVLVACSLEVAVLLLFGHFAYNVAFPSTLERWWTFIWVTLLGATAMSLVGIAISSLPRTARSAAPVVNLPFLVLEFISGVFVPFTSLSHGIYKLAGFFPLRWIAQGYRSEPTRAWDHGQTVLALAIWCVVGLVVSARTFRWTGRGER
jgi:ABC-2 type transport system permease protein